ncbi:MAG: phenylalanine--tRNA ligase subunit alpha [Candidatus Aenigmarchaeota archaeon]|nr:phenylalanine--tRNA ligase subunit alpha [Candidatus Aenigmarchaeota archaeon]
MYRLTKEGKECLNHGLPETQLIRLLEIKKAMHMDEAKQAVKDFSIAVQWAKKKNFIEMKGSQISLLSMPKTFSEEDALRNVNHDEHVPDNMISLLLQRKLIEEIRDDVRAKAEKHVGREVATLSPELIGTGVWRDVKFKEYNIKAIGVKTYPGKKQPYAAFLDWVKQKMVGLGFEEMTGPIVETEFWNMDALYMPQHHAARDIHDAYFLKEPKYAKDIDKNILSAVKQAHEKGIEESRGWEYQYNVKRAHKLILRTQGTVLSAKTLASRPNIPGKYFSISRCFRYDVVDAKHLPDFYQLEGIVIDKGLNFRHLIGLLKMFAKEVANAEKIKIMPSYFPFTEPSCQLMANHSQFGWLELGGAGLFRKEMTEPLGIKEPVIAWGLGIDRLFMLSVGINDIRQLFSHDLNYLRSAKVLY